MDTGDDDLELCIARQEELRRRLNDNIQMTSTLLLNQKISPLSSLSPKQSPPTSPAEKLRALGDMTTMTAEDLHKVGGRMNRPCCDRRPPNT